MMPFHSPSWTYDWARDDEWATGLELAIAESLKRAGPKPAPEDTPIHFIEDPSWPVGARSLCERGDHGGERPGPHGWHVYTDRPGNVTCKSCLEWMHA